MSRREPEGEWHDLVKIPAVDQEDRVLAGLTVRQVVQLGAVVAVLWLAYQATHSYLRPLVFVITAAPVLALAVAAVLTRRDGISLERWLLAAWHHRRTPRRLLPTGPDQQDFVTDRLADPGLAPLPLPAHAVAADGTVDLGDAGRSSISTAGTVNFALRTAAEQRMLIGGFGRWLNALTAPVQILVRTHRLDLAPMVAELRERAPGLPHRLLEDAAHAHADFLTHLAAGRDLLARQVLLVQHEPGSDRTAAQRVQRRAAEAASLLAGCEVQAALLDRSGAYAVLLAACDPSTPPHSDPAVPDIPVTFTSGGRS
ncbi:PrgI family protein [Streptacidiphilus sp. N1-10]|uniref:PrgI family protein n=1 Tax=Streptacidiphilus jeojiensis TaxID=3229225 RepID=A0ABV6XIA6_9ACTN